MSDPTDPFDDPDAPPTPQEQAAAARLRDALEEPGTPLPEAELARALSAAWRPQDLPVERHRSLVRAALAGRRGLVVRATFGVATALAVAAAVLLVVRGEGPPGAPAGGAAALAVSRSTQQLFGAPFPRAGGESARIDRIAVARAADLRDNEFARWGVR